MKSCLLFLFLLGSFIGRAQTWDEFFKQKKTQKKYLLEQLVALKVYAGYAVKGYQTVHSGLDLIRQLTGGEFSMHDFFISSLNGPSPLVRNNARVGQIILFQLRIRQALKGVGQADLSEEQRQYVSTVRDKVLEDCEKDLADLALVLGSGDLTMDDSERLQRLDRICVSLQEKWQFTGSFASGVRIMMLMKHLDLRNGTAAGKLYGITDH